MIQNAAVVRGAVEPYELLCKRLHIG